MDYRDGDDAPREGGSRSRKRWDEYAALTEGDYTFAACVNQVVRWERGTSVTLKAMAPGNEDHDGRQVEWPQSPPPGMSEKFLEVWRRTFFGAYAAGGWTVDADPAKGWNGWAPSATMGASGKPLPLPPYDRFFVAPADRNVWAPVVLLVDVRVDKPPYDRYPKVTAVRPLLTAAGKRVQAPMPWRVVDWIADMYGWVGDAPERVNKAVKPLVKLDYKQVEKGAGDLVWWWDAREEIKSATRVPRPRPAGTADIPF